MTHDQIITALEGTWTTLAPDVKLSIRNLGTTLGIDTDQFWTLLSELMDQLEAAP